MEGITDHIERHIGKPGNVFHELVSELVHVDVHRVPPAPGRDFHVLVTTGMSDLPMSAPEGMEDCRYAELMLCLPPEWPLSQDRLEEEENYWPIRWLKTLARFPHEYETWLWWGHTVPNGDPPEPYAANTKLCCMMLLRPMFAPEEFLTLEMSDDKTVSFFSLVPLYKKEVEYKLKKGMEALLDRFAERNISEVIDPARENVCDRPGLLGRIFGGR